MPKKKFKIKRQSNLEYSTGPAFSATSKSRQVADRMYERSGGDASGLQSKLFQNADGSYTRKSVDSSPAMMKKGGKVKSKKDACYHKVKARYSVWPSAYASGALAKCRKVGASNWGNKGKK